VPRVFQGFGVLRNAGVLGLGVGFQLGEMVRRIKR